MTGHNRHSTTEHIMKITPRPELKDCKRIVVKVGSNVVTKKNGKCDLRKMRIIVEDICDLMDSGYEIILVSSGSVNVGKAFLKKFLPEDSAVNLSQSASSIGQPKLLNKYANLFEDHQHVCAQILLTHDDIRNRKRFLHAKKTINVLLKNKVTPILNENDSISFTEITVGDNDHLAASAAQMTNADALIIITSAKGLYDKDPKEEGAKLIEQIKFSQNLDHIDMTTKTEVGKGGMASKVHAVNKVTPLGIKAIISSKDNNRIIIDPITKNTGTFFGPKTTIDPELKKAWFISTKKLNCYIDVNEKAYKNLIKGKALSPSSVKKASGHFYKGDCVDIVYNKSIFAVGVTEYSKTDIDKIKEKDSDKIEGLLGYKASNYVVKPENYVIIGENENA